MAGVYLDNDVSFRVAPLVQAAGHQAVTARNIGRSYDRDDIQLLTAAERGWALVTHNAKDFTLPDDAWRHWSVAWGVSPEHAGILVLAQATAAERVRGRMNEVDLTQFIINILGSGSPRPNELRRWLRGQGWVRQS